MKNLLVDLRCKLFCVTGEDTNTSFGNTSKGMGEQIEFMRLVQIKNGKDATEA